ncbi:MAG: type II toxin-antitoxin system VapC family toxin [Chthoniobacteraceae bacterium]
MAWVVDTSVLLDIHAGHPEFAEASASCLIKHSEAGLVISPVTYIELAPAFGGDVTLQEQFLSQVGVEWSDLWTAQDTRSAHALWAEHVKRKRSGITGKRPLADVLIEAFARRFEGLITRNPKHFKEVPLVVPYLLR